MNLGCMLFAMAVLAVSVSAHKHGHEHHMAPLAASGPESLVAPVPERISHTGEGRPQNELRSESGYQYERTFRGAAKQSGTLSDADPNFVSSSKIMKGMNPHAIPEEIKEDPADMAARLGVEPESERGPQQLLSQAPSAFTQGVSSLETTLLDPTASPLARHHDGENVAQYERRVNSKASLMENDGYMPDEAKPSDDKDGDKAKPKIVEKVFRPPSL